MPAIFELRHIPVLSNDLHFACLMHNCHDDSRYIELPDGGKIKFDSNLNVFNGLKQVGVIRTVEDVYHLENSNGALHNLLVKCNDWHWKNLEDAEIAAAVYLNNIFVEAKDKLSDTAFEDFVKSELGDIAVKD